MTNADRQPLQNRASHNHRNRSARLKRSRWPRLERQELMSEGKNLSLQCCTSLKDLPSRRKQRENDHEHVAEKLQRRLPKFNQFSQNGVFGRDS
jgi:hypothetical protein